MAARIEQVRLDAVEPDRGEAVACQRIGEPGLVEQRRMRDADDDLVGPAERQEALAEQSAVAAEVRQLHADGVGLLQQLAQSERLDAPALPHGVVRMQRRVVADEPGLEARQHLSHRARRRRHAHQAHRARREFAPGELAARAHHRKAPQQRQQRLEMNSASAGADAVRQRTTSTPARVQASRSMFSAPALTWPTARSSGACCSSCASTASAAGTIRPRTS